MSINVKNIMHMGHDTSFDDRVGQRRGCGHGKRLLVGTMSNTAKDGYCNRCDAPRSIHRSVPWQDDTCAVCGGTDVDITSDPST